MSGIRTRAVRDGDEWVINGSKTYITNGHRADFIVLVTKTDPDAGYDGFTLFLVDMDAPGVVREKKLEKLGMHASDTALLAFQDVRVPDDAVLGQVGKGFYHIMWELQGERLIGAAGCVAGAQRAFDRTLAYALERKAFGREIGHFQVIRHKFAAMATKIEACRAARLHDRLALRQRRVPRARDLDGQAARLADVLRGRRRVPADPRRRGLHARVQDRAGVARPAPEPDRRRHRRDHARRDRAVVRACRSLRLVPHMGVLDDKVAIVTGSARGIGRATAELLSEHGAKVVINDLDADLAEQAASEIAGETAVYGGDLTADGAPDALVQTAIDAWGKIDIIVNNAGYTIDAPIHKMSDDAYQRMLDIHTVVPFRVIRAAAPHLREPAKASARRAARSSARSSTCPRSRARWATPARPTTRPARPRSSGLTKTLAKEWGQFKINVNAVAFGWIETRLTAAKDATNTMEIGGQTVQLGIPEQMRSMAAMLDPDRPARARPRRPPAACSSSARRGRTSSTGRC